MDLETLAVYLLDLYADALAKERASNNELSAMWYWACSFSHSQVLELIGYTSWARQIEKYFESGLLLPYGF